MMKLELEKKLPLFKSTTPSKLMELVEISSKGAQGKMRPLTALQNTFESEKELSID